MKKLIALLILCFCLLAGCITNGLPNSEVSVNEPSKTERQEDSIFNAEPVNAELAAYLSQTSEYIEPTNVEWENGQIAFKDDILYDTLYRVSEDGTKNEIINKVSDWTPLAEHAILVVHDGYLLVKVDTQEWTTETLYEAEYLMTAINTNGTLVYIITETRVFRYFIPTNTTELIITDDMFDFLLAPFSTTDICWASYNPIWLKKYYQLGGDENIYNVAPTYYFFYDTKTRKTYHWVPEHQQQTYLDGIAWYHQQKQ